jgi:hypothetical protein
MAHIYYGVTIIDRYDGPDPGPRVLAAEFEDAAGLQMEAERRGLKAETRDHEDWTYKLFVFGPVDELVDLARWAQEMGIRLDAFYVADDDAEIESAARALAEEGLEPEIGWREPQRAAP